MMELTILCRYRQIFSTLSTWSRVLFLCLSLGFSSFVFAQQDMLGWIKRIQQASANKSYYGEIQYYRIGQPSRTLEFAHLGKGNYSHELLRGPYQGVVELIRSDSGISVYGINQKQTRLFNQPSLQWLSDSQASVIAGNYRLEKGGTATVAGRKTEIIILKPILKDRHEYRVWVDIETGILMASSRRNELGEIVESFYFLRFKTGPNTQERLSAYYQVISREQGKGNATAEEKDLKQPVEQYLTFSYLPAGFSEIEELRRQIAKDIQADQWVFSDGLNTISVFFKPLSKEGTPGVFSERRGASSIAIKHSVQCEIVVVGEVPLDVATKIVNGVKHRRDE